MHSPLPRTPVSLPVTKGIIVVEDFRPTPLNFRLSGAPAFGPLGLDELSILFYRDITDTRAPR